MTYYRELLRQPQRAHVVKWLLDHGFVDENGQLAICWSDRTGHEHISLLFCPINRTPEDAGWDVGVRHHASGTHPSLLIGLCETLEDVERTYEAMRLINGYKEPEGHRGREPEPATDVIDGQ